MAPPPDSNGRLGFNLPLMVVLLAGIGLIFVGQILQDSTLYAKAGEDTQNTEATAALFRHLGALAAGAALLFAGIGGRSTHTALRALLVVLGIILVFDVISFDFRAGFGR